MVNSNNTQLLLRDKIEKVVFTCVFITSLVFVLLVYKSYFYSFFIAMGCYIIFRKPFFFLVNVVKTNRTLAALVLTIIIFFLIVTPLSMLFYLAVNEVHMVAKQLNYLSQQDTSIFQMLQGNVVMDKILLYLKAVIPNIETQIIQITTKLGTTGLLYIQALVENIFQTTFYFFLSLLTLFFIFRDGDRLAPIVYKVLPFSDELEQTVWDKTVNILDAILKGNLSIALCQGIALGSYFFFFGLSAPIFFGGVAIFVSLIPIIGTSIIWLPAALYLYVVQNSPMMAISLSVLCLFTFLMLENIVKPWVLDRKLKIHPLFLFLAILGGITEFGIKGLIIGPFIVAIFLVFWELLLLFTEYEVKHK